MTNRTRYKAHQDTLDASSKVTKKRQQKRGNKKESESVQF